MKDKIKKVSRVLLRPTKEFYVRIHLKLVKEKDGREENFHSLFTADDGSGYLSLDLQSFLTLEIKDGAWSPDKSIIVDQRNIYQLIKGIKKSLDGIYNGGVFALNKKGETVMYADMKEKHTQRIYNIGQQQRLVIQPAIVYDDNETTYEGVILFINNSNNYVELPIDAFESLYYTLKQVNFFVYSQVLLQYYISTVKDEKIELKNVSMEGKYKKKKKSVFSTEEQEFTKSTVKPKKEAEEFFGFTKTEE
jgi:hypothetical protein